jgi:hypothetical protein
VTNEMMETQPTLKTNPLDSERSLNALEFTNIRRLADEKDDTEAQFCIAVAFEKGLFFLIYYSLLYYYFYFVFLFFSNL